MHALGAVARNSVLGSPTEKSRDGPLHHAHAGVANQLCPALPPKQDVLRHQGRSPTEGQFTNFFKYLRSAGFRSEDFGSRGSHFITFKN